MGASVPSARGISSRATVVDAGALSGRRGRATSDATGSVSDQLDVLTLGEALVAMTPASTGPLRGVTDFSRHMGGAELNVAVGLARLGHRAGWAGALGDDEFGRGILAFLRSEAVEVAGARLDDSAPTGVYFKERRALGRLRVHYYRAGSAASRMRFADLDVEYLLSGRILHLTGITAALSDSCRELTQELVSAASERGVTVSFDANVRRLLFRERDPRAVLGPIVAGSDILFLSDDEADLLLGGHDPDSVEAARRRMGVATVVVHRAEGAFAVEDSGLSSRDAYSVDVVDVVGAGDAFVAGFLSARLEHEDTGECLDRANACGACAVTVPGDAEGLPSREDVLELQGRHFGIER
jgi:2-dehydro-3-deoxygluconokinase